MSFTNEEIQEFKIEALDLLAEAEVSLLKVEKGEAFTKNYDSIFRAFHSLKGASGMLELTDLQNHMHKIENLFQQFKDSPSINPAITTFFLNSIDGARSLLDFEPIEFSYSLPIPETDYQQSEQRDKKILTQSPSANASDKSMIFVTKVDLETKKVSSVDPKESELLDRAVDMLLFKYQDTNDYLISRGKKELALILRKEIEELLKARKKLRQNA